MIAPLTARPPYPDGWDRFRDALMAAELFGLDRARPAAGGLWMASANGALSDEIRAVMLFGSVARGEASLQSDKEHASAEPDPRRRADYGALALVFAELAGHVPVWRQALEGWNMRESQQVLEWQAEGRIEAKREVLLRLLQLRFTPSLPEDLTATVAVMRR